MNEMKDQKKEIEGHRWYLVLAKRGAERLAQQNLERQGFDAYLPMHAPGPLIPKAGKPTAPIPRPFLPGYLFVSVDLGSASWRKIFSTIGVRSIYMTGSGESARPRALPNSWIEQLQIREVNGLIVRPHQDQIKCAYTNGQAISVRGRTADLSAVFLEPVDAKRVMILVSLFGRDSRQVVDEASIGPRAD